MNGFVLQLLWYLLYFFHIEMIGTIEKGAGKRVLTFVLGFFLLLSSLLIGSGAAWLCICLLLLLYGLFFGQEAFLGQWRQMAVPGMVLAGASLLPEEGQFLVNGFLLLLFFCLPAKQRGYLRWWNGAVFGALLGLVSWFVYLVQSGKVGAGERLSLALVWGGLFLEYLFFALLEGIFQFYRRDFDFQSQYFQGEVLHQQYEEIRKIYSDMRGWRHDYHNHLQVLKAQLALGKLSQAGSYLDELEKSLNQVDDYMKSGNQMADAILNGKLSLAGEKGISVTCKARLPEQLSMSDVDLCVILGNLLDNALEACEQIPADKRFLRIYMAVNKFQLYISIQNSAKEDLNFKEKHYISTKRGNHGLGMKRVQAAVEKYQGFLRLANEPGIFAAEVTMPLK